MKEYKLELSDQWFKVKYILTVDEEITFEEATLKAVDMLSHNLHREKYKI